MRLIFVAEDAPEFARALLDGKWTADPDAARLVEVFNDSTVAVREAVRDRIETGRAMNLHYDHPILMLQHLIWHEGYHHGQIKLALRGIGRSLIDDEVGPVTWHIWTDKEPQQPVVQGAL